jgi:S-layer homology domain
MERFIGAVSLTVLLMGLAAVAQVQPEASRPISKLVSPTSRKLLNPNQFAADSLLSRAELAQLLVTAFRLRSTPAAAQDNATDVPQFHWAKAEIQTVLSRGIMSRDRQGRFNPNQPVARAEALAALAKAQGKKPLPETVTQEILSRYPDAVQVPVAQRGAIAASIQTGGFPLEAGKIAPSAPITRGDMVKVLGVYLGQNKK